MTLPFNATFAATFPDNLPVANWADGSPNFLLSGIGTTILNNRLSGSASVFLVDNTDVNIGSLVFKVKVPYSGAPAVNQTIAMLSGSSVADWVVNFFHRTDSVVEVLFGAGGSYPAGSAGGFIWNPIAGEEYEFKITWDYDITKKFRMFMGNTAAVYATLVIDADTTFIMPVLTPIPAIDLVSFGRDALTPIDFPGYEFFDILMYDTVLNPTDTSYIIQHNYIPDIKPPLALPECAVYGRVLYNNLPVTDATITFKPSSTYIYQGVISNYTKVLTTDSTGYFEVDIPMSGTTKCKYKCTFTVGGIVYSKSGELTIPTEEFLIIQ